MLFILTLDPGKVMEYVILETFLSEGQEGDLV